MKHWVVVENPGQDNETVVAEFEMYLNACDFLDGYDEDDVSADVMFRFSDGSLTTDY